MKKSKSLKQSSLAVYQSRARKGDPKAIKYLFSRKIDIVEPQKRGRKPSITTVQTMSGKKKLVKGDLKSQFEYYARKVEETKIKSELFTEYKKIDPKTGMPKSKGIPDTSHIKRREYEETYKKGVKVTTKKGIKKVYGVEAIKVQIGRMYRLSSNIEKKSRFIANYEKALRQNIKNTKFVKDVISKMKSLSWNEIRNFIDTGILKPIEYYYAIQDAEKQLQPFLNITSNDLSNVKRIEGFVNEKYKDVQKIRKG